VHRLRELEAVHAVRHDIGEKQRNIGTRLEDRRSVVGIQCLDGGVCSSGLHGWLARMGRSRMTVMEEYRQVVANGLVGRHSRFEQSFLNGAWQIRPERESSLTQQPAELLIGFAHLILRAFRTPAALIRLEAAAPVRGKNS
jgi:hypothetical protein